MLDVSGPPTETAETPRLIFALHRNSTWCQEKIDQLVALRKAGKSQNEIAKELNITKNAVAGQCHRLKIPCLRKPTENKGFPQPSRRKPKVGVHLPPIYLHNIPIIEPDSGSRCSLIGLTNKNCHHPIGEPLSPDFMFCGAIAVQDKPYCLFHCAKNYQSVRR